MSVEIFDTHAHLLDKVYDDRRDEILARALRENLYIIESALNETEWKDALRLSSEFRFRNLFFTIGIHPHNAKEYANEKKLAVLSEGFKEIFTQSEKCLAIGETGLDYHYKNSAPPEQKIVFRRQIEIALEISKPIVIHCREAYEDCLEILLSYSNNWRGVIHCFSGDVKEAEKFLTLGFYLGITCPLTYAKSEKLRNVVASAPIERLLTETDSPYLPPAQLRGKINEPTNVRFVVEEIAKIKNVSFSTAAKFVAENARRVFGIK